MTKPKRISIALLKLSISLVFIFLAIKALGFGGFSSSIIASFLVIAGFTHHAFWYGEEDYKTGEIE